MLPRAIKLYLASLLMTDLYFLVKIIEICSLFPEVNFLSENSFRLHENKLLTSLPAEVQAGISSKRSNSNNKIT